MAIDVQGLMFVHISHRRGKEGHCVVPPHAIRVRAPSGKRLAVRRMHLSLEELHPFPITHLWIVQAYEMTQFASEFTRRLLEPLDFGFQFVPASRR